ncbi:hypothetical protein NM208_g4625 [Fusarium decemcellulare]|uniref:Uncharacterized protein n=1 Tax=Fusarium decemcellulare TaxID=57161 RepID=A0ACC1SKG4_9HYPO|nr:hypothetical protein NM208_g4625 [Fusarium decemcellulare]
MEDIEPTFISIHFSYTLIQTNPQMDIHKPSKSFRLNMKSQFTQLAMLAAAFVGMGLFEGLPVAHAMPATEKTLHARNAALPDFETIYISKVTDQIFGQDATHYDYSIIESEKDLAIAALHQFAAAYINGAPSNNIIVTFVNATMAGHMQQDQARNMTWLCGELDNDMLPQVSECAHVEKRARAVGLEKRSRFRWTSDRKNVSSRFGMQVLASYFGSLAWNTFPISPRSYCQSGACISWQKPLAGFCGYFAQFILQDGISATDFNKNSAQAFKAVNDAAVCLSNRATGCK